MESSKLFYHNFTQLSGDLLILSHNKYGIVFWTQCVVKTMVNTKKYSKIKPNRTIHLVMASKHESNWDVFTIHIRAVERLIFFNRVNRAINYFNRALTR